MDSLDILQKEDDTESENMESPAAPLGNPIDPETLIDIIHFSSESWEDLDSLAHEQRDHAKLQKYYIDLAMYNRKLELLKMGYFDVFEPNDETIFQDSLTFSMETSLTLREEMEAMRAAERAQAVNDVEIAQYAAEDQEEPGMLDSITRLFFPRVCFQ
jgi:hypothetical protein